VMTMMSNWSRSSRGGRVDVGRHCGDRVHVYVGLNAYGGLERCWSARETWEGDVHLIDTCDIPCVFFVDVSLVGVSETLQSVKSSSEAIMLHGSSYRQCL